MSVSESWYVVKDHGTNYCNLYNLLEGKIKQKSNKDTIHVIFLSQYIFIASSAIHRRPCIYLVNGRIIQKKDSIRPLHYKVI